MKFRIRFVVALALVVVMVADIVSFGSTCADVRKDVLRLHVVAASDTQADQQLKLLVRDAVLEAGGELFGGTVKADEAVKLIAPKTDLLVAAAESVLRENGCDYDVEIIVGEEYFSTRCYEEFTMPAGVYTAVRVNIGSARGKNWWCVMFPPLCVPSVLADADAFFDDDEIQVISASPEYEPRFKIVEIYESIKQKLVSRF